MDKESFNEKEYLNIKSLGHYIDASRTTVYRLIKRGKLPAPKQFGAVKRWKKSEVDEFLNRA